MVADLHLTWTTLLLLAAGLLLVLAAVFGTTSPGKERNWHFWAGLGFACFFFALFAARV